MVKIRLKRMGAKKRAFYRVVVMDSKTKRDGKSIAELGYYDAVKDPREVKINKEEALKWLKEGAQPTDTVKNLFSSEGIMEEFHNIKFSKKN